MFAEKPALSHLTAPTDQNRAVRGPRAKRVDVSHDPLPDGSPGMK